MAGAVMMAAVAWTNMRALRAFYGGVCGSDAGLLGHCPACYAAFGLFLLSLTSYAMARARRRGALAVRR